MNEFRMGDIVEYHSEGSNHKLNGSVGIVVEVGGDGLIYVDWVVCTDWEMANHFRERHPRADSCELVNVWTRIGRMEGV
jgi:hypothetical protein